MGLFACLPAELRRNSYGLLDNLAVKRTQKKRGDVLVRRTNEPPVRPSTAKEDLPWRLLASENPTPTETDFPQLPPQLNTIVFLDRYFSFFGCKFSLGKREKKFFSKSKLLLLP
jgi:hypothetical protein